MTSERSQAYGRVMKIVRDVGPTKLHDAEQQRIREAADGLFFSEDLASDETARASLLDVRTLARHLVESERWEEESAEQLLADLEGCGPLSPVA